MGKWSKDAEAGSAISTPNSWCCWLIPRSGITLGVAHLQILFSMPGRELVTVSTAEKAEDDLMGDFVAIFTFSCARLYWRRCVERKTERVLAALQ